MSISIKIFSDFTCPFCYLGKGLVEALKREYDIHEEWVSYELHPEVPPEGVLLSEKFPDYDLEGLFQELRTKGARYGYTFGNVTLLPNTRKALEAGEFARDQGKHATFHAAVFHAYFGENRNIGQIPVLLDIASRVGLDRDTLERALNEGPVPRPPGSQPRGRGSLQCERSPHLRFRRWGEDRGPPFHRSVSPGIEGTSPHAALKDARPAALLLDDG